MTDTIKEQVKDSMITAKEARAQTEASERTALVKWITGLCECVESQSRVHHEPVAYSRIPRWVYREKQFRADYNVPVKYKRKHWYSLGKKVEAPLLTQNATIEMTYDDVRAFSTKNFNMYYILKFFLDSGYKVYVDLDSRYILSLRIEW